MTTNPRIGESYEGGQLDITGSEIVEIRIKNDGTVIWVTTETGPALRICRIKELTVVDERD